VQRARPTPARCIGEPTAAPSPTRGSRRTEHRPSVGRAPRTRSRAPPRVTIWGGSDSIRGTDGAHYPDGGHHRLRSSDAPGVGTTGTDDRAGHGRSEGCGKVLLIDEGITFDSGLKAGCPAVSPSGSCPAGCSARVAATNLQRVPG
jgi:hypothetical protein